jgi:hypothetical protein
MSVKYFKTKTVHIVSGSSKWGTPKVILSRYVFNSTYLTISKKKTFLKFDLVSRILSLIETNAGK